MSTAIDIHKVNTTLEDGITYLCKSNVANFYAYIFNSLERVYAPGLGTFGCGPKGSRYALFIDPVYAMKLPFMELVATLEHEMLHIVLDHCPRGIRFYQTLATDLERKLYTMVRFVAADCADNEILRETQKGVDDPAEPLGFWHLPEKHDMPRGLSYEEYVAILMARHREDAAKVERLWDRVRTLLKDALDVMQQALPSDETCPLEQLGPSKEQGELEDPEEEKLAQQMAESMKTHLSELLTDHVDPAKPEHLHTNGVTTVRNAARSYKKSHGSLPGGVAELVEAFLEPPVVGWNELFAALVAQSLVSKPVRGMRRVSKMRAALSLFMGRKIAAYRRLPLFPGTTRDMKFRIYFVIDTSGSMTVKDMNLGLSELQRVLKSGVDLEIIVLYVDTEVAKAYTIGPDDQIDPELVGRGGTDFETAFAYIAERMQNGVSCDLVAYVTDGYANKPSTKLPVTTVWIITAGGKPIMRNEPGHITLEAKNYPAGEVFE